MKTVYVITCTFADLLTLSTCLIAFTRLSVFAVLGMTAVTPNFLTSISRCLSGSSKMTTVGIDGFAALNLRINCPFGMSGRSHRVTTVSILWCSLRCLMASMPLLELMILYGKGISHLSTLINANG